MKNYLALIFMCSVFNLFSQSPVEVGLKKYKDFRIPEKVFIHTDKDIYAVGETIWMAAYLVDGQTHLPGTVTKSLKVELRDRQGEIILNQILFSDKGHAAGDFLIPNSAQPGGYQVVGYTNFQLNNGTEFLFRKNIQIIAGIQESEELTEKLPTNSNNNSIFPEKKLKNNIRFFPEGGDCISGIPCQVAFVIENELQEPQSVVGFLVDEKGEKLIEITSNEFGIGKLKYLPKVEERFWMELSKTNEKIELPQPISKGYHMNIKQEKDSIKIFAKTNFSKGMKNTRVVIHLRGMPLLNKKIETDNSFIWLKVDKKSIGEGVVVCTLFDDQDSPVAERLFFIPPDPERFQLEITLENESLETRQDATLKFQTSGKSITPEKLDSSRLSVSIIPSFVNSPAQSDDIRTWLLLNSDINLQIPFASELIFGKDKSTQIGIIDDFMMTRGWRRFRWKSILSSENLSLNYVVEEGVFIKGRMGVFEKPKKARPGKVYITQPDTGLSEETMTDENGYFEFGPYGFFNTLNIYLEGRYKAGKRNRLNPKINRDNNAYVFLELLQDGKPKIPMLPNFQKDKIEKEMIQAYKGLSEKKLTIAENYDSLSILLDEVEVKTRMINVEEKKRDERTSLYLEPSNRIVVDDLAGSRMARSVFDLLRRIPGITVSGFGLQQSARIRGVGSLGGSITPAYFLDDVPVNEEFIRGLSVDNIDFIDVLKGGKSAILGSRAANGAILIYTRTGSSINKEPTPGLLNFEMEGFYKAREFSVFDSQNPDNQDRPDVRTTIHWNPNLRTNSEGIVKENFLTSDQTGKFIIVVQGLRGDGKPVYGTKEFTVE